MVRHLSWIAVVIACGLLVGCSMVITPVPPPTAGEGTSTPEDIAPAASEGTSIPEEDG
jgi:hypothetical protein